MTVLGKVEGRDELWHGHVTAVTVAPEYRRLRLGDRLMKMLENVSEKVYVFALAFSPPPPFFFLDWSNLYVCIRYTHTHTQARCLLCGSVCEIFQSTCNRHV